MDPQRTLRQMTHFLLQALASVLVCFVLGIIIGLLCRKRVALTVIMATLASFAIVVLLEWWNGNHPERWWEYDAVYIVQALVVFFPLILVPTVGGALGVALWDHRQRKSGDQYHAFAVGPSGTRGPDLKQ